MVNIPMFFCLRKLVTTFVLVYEWMAFGKTQDRWTATSVLGISVGTVLAGWDTLNDEVLGYLITMLNNVRNFVHLVCMPVVDEFRRLPLTLFRMVAGVLGGVSSCGASARVTHKCEVSLFSSPQRSLYLIS
jgi:hypothetical protein